MSGSTGSWAPITTRCPRTGCKLFERYRFQDYAFKAVGVGSVGTHCYVVLYLADDNDPLLLQVKEARPSVLEPYAGKGPFDHHGQRIVVGQRLVQAASDIFLGWTTGMDGMHFYIRQLRDMKFSVPLVNLEAKGLANYAAVCGWALARAHAKGGDAAMISGYLGQSDAFDQALAKFAPGLCRPDGTRPCGAGQGRQSGAGAGGRREVKAPPIGRACLCYCHCEGPQPRSNLAHAAGIASGYRPRNDYHSRKRRSNPWRSIYATGASSRSSTSPRRSSSSSSSCLPT